jgi:TetR/AcrR family transcriptional regulator
MQQDKETYFKIIQAGKEILNKKDYHGTVVEEIAQLAGVAKGTIFFYFKTKEVLFKEILLSLLNELEEEINKILDDVKLQALQKLKKVYDTYIDFQIKNMNLFIAIKKELAKEETVSKIEEIKDKLQKLSQKLLPVIEEMFKKGLIKKFDPSVELIEFTPSMLLAYASAVSFMVFFYKDKIEKLKEIFWQILLHGILNEDVSINMLIFNNEK